jgi:hypothetical protein
VELDDQVAAFEDLHVEVVKSSLRIRDVLEFDISEAA